MAINFRIYPTILLSKKILFVIYYLDKSVFNWVQPRFEFFLGKRWQKTETKNSTNVLQIWQFLHIYINKKIGNQNENKTIEKQFLILKQTQSTMVYRSKFKILIYTIKWDDTAFASQFYEKLKNKIKDAMVAMDRPKSLKIKINDAVKIDER